MDSSAIKVDAAAVNDLANRMDELSSRAQSVLQRYEQSHSEIAAAGGFKGDAEAASTKTGLEIHAAQMKIQAKFQHVNELLRSNASRYTNTNEENASHIQQVAGGLRYT